jgi:hypothetical protein
MDAFSDVAIPADASVSVKQLWGTGITLLDAVRFAVANMKTASKAPSLTVNEAIPLFLAAGEANNNRSTTRESYNRTFPPYIKSFGDREMSSVTEKEMTEFFNRPKVEGKRQGWSRESKKTYLRVGKALWAWAKVPWPAPDYTPPKEDVVHGVDFWSVSDCIAAMLVCPPQWRGNLAASIFVGLRPFTVRELRSEWFRESEDRIVIPAHVLKTREPYQLADVPRVLWDWLRVYPVREMSTEALISRLQRQGVHYSQDIARHTCGTFTFRRHGLDGAVRVLGHSSVGLIKSNYANNGVSEAEALEFFALTPAKVFPNGDVNWTLPRSDSYKKYLPTLPPLSASVQTQSQHSVQSTPAVQLPLMPHLCGV